MNKKNYLIKLIFGIESNIIIQVINNYPKINLLLKEIISIVITNNLINCPKFFTKQNHEFRQIEIFAITK
jgi:hypothetical protein